MFGWFEKQFWHLAIRLIRRGWGANCETRDIDDIPFEPNDLNAPNRCGSCAAREVIEWIETHYIYDR